jgi:hypothetical protein
MIVERMNDSEFALEVIRDYFDEMRNYAERALVLKGKIKKRHASNYVSKRGNQWFIIYRPEYGGQYSLHVKRCQPREWFSWYSLILEQGGITLFGFNKHVAERISERYHPELTPSEALKEMLVKTPAIIQAEVEDSFYTRINGGICLGSVYGRRMSINVGGQSLQVELRKVSTFVSDEDLFDDQKVVTDESIARSISKLGKDYLSDHDQEEFSEP